MKSVLIATMSATLGFTAAVALFLLLNFPTFSTPAVQPSQHRETFWEKTQSDPVAYFTLWLVGFTGVLAISTIGLWIVTRRMGKGQSKDMRASIAVAQQAADAALLNAQAAIGIELPVIRSRRAPGIIALPDNALEGTYQGGGIYTEHPRNRSAVVGFEFVNFGRTPAFPLKLQIGWYVGDTLPIKSNYFIEIACKPDAIIKSDGGEFSAPRPNKHLLLSEAEQNSLANKTTTLWVYVSLYFSDFLNKPHEARFCWSGYGYLSTSATPPPDYTKFT